MTLTGITTAQCQQLLEPLLPEEYETALAAPDYEQIFAQVVWSLLAEPGDGVAGTVLDTVAASTALEALIRGRLEVESFLKFLPESAAQELRGQLSLADLAEGLARWAPRLSLQATTRALQHLTLLKVSLLTPTSPLWPQGLADLGPYQPMVLWLRGNIAQLPRLQRSIALVGARAASAYGEHVVMELATGLDSRGVEIVSGGAYGIDGMAHRAALANQSSTTAILAGGIDRLYPAGHEALFQRVLAQGIILAESAPGTPPTRWRFLQRNRLIAAISQATIVVEAGYRSGSLNTAAHAGQLGRPLGAVPGPITSATSMGCHRLLREFGADCITGVEDALALLGETTAHDESPQDLFSKDEMRILDALSTKQGRDTGEIARHTGFSFGEVCTLLGLLELKNFAQRSDNLWLKGEAGLT